MFFKRGLILVLSGEESDSRPLLFLLAMLLFLLAMLLFLLAMLLFLLAMLLFLLVMMMMMMLVMLLVMLVMLLRLSINVYQSLELHLSCIHKSDARSVLSRVVLGRTPANNVLCAQGALACAQ